MSIKYYHLAKDETTPDEFCAIRDVSGEPSEYMFYVSEAENAELREYAAYLLDFIEPAAHQSSCNRACPAYKICAGSTRCVFVNWAMERARELGVEVDDA